MKRKAKKSIIYLVIIFIVITILLFTIYRFIIFPKKYSDIVENMSNKYGVESNLVYSIIKQESKFNKDAISTSGAKGLMQLMHSTAREVARKIKTIDVKNFDLFEPNTNIEIGTKYISYLLNHYNNNYFLAIAAYNAGMGKVDNWAKNDYSSYKTIDDVLEIIEYKETKTFLKNVIKFLDYYNLLY